MPSSEILKDIASNLKSSASVDMVFGDTRLAQGKALIPVASIQYAFGAGGGTGSKPAGEGERTSTGAGDGGGGAVKARPVAVLEVTPDDTRVVPVVDYTRLASRFLGGLLVWWILRSFRRKSR